MDAALAVAVLGGLVLNARPSRWWADPSADPIVAGYAVKRPPTYRAIRPTQTTVRVRPTSGRSWPAVRAGLVLVTAVRRGVRRLGPGELWTLPAKISGLVLGLLAPVPYCHNLIVQALNEHFMDQGEVGTTPARTATRPAAVWNSALRGRTGQPKLVVCLVTAISAYPAPRKTPRAPS